MDVYNYVCTYISILIWLIINLRAISQTCICIIINVAYILKCNLLTCTFTHIYAALCIIIELVDCVSFYYVLII